jgi:hypothetical protein
MRLIDRFMQTLLNVPPRPVITFTGSALTEFKDSTVEFLCDRIKGANIIDDDAVELYTDDGPFCTLRFRDETELTDLLCKLKDKRPCRAIHRLP